MATFLFYYTLVILIASIFTSASCLSAYLVSHKKTALYAFIGFLFYFFDNALVFQEDFISYRNLEHTAAFDSIGIPLAFLVYGTGLIASFCLVICEYLNIKSKALRWAPPIIFAILSALTLICFQERNVREFAFFTVRIAFVFTALVYIGIHFLKTKRAHEKGRLLRHIRIYLALWLFGILTLAENIVFLLIYPPDAAATGLLPFYPERNFAENALFLCLAYCGAHNSIKLLSFYFKRPPIQEDGSQLDFIETNLIFFSQKYKLSERETEVLRYILLGKDNQNIASAMSVALSTVKVHVHHILKKTSASNKQDLIQMFWKA